MEPIPFDNMHGLDDVEAEVEEEEHFPLQTLEEEIPSGEVEEVGGGPQEPFLIDSCPPLPSLCSYTEPLLNIPES